MRGDWEGDVSGGGRVQGGGGRQGRTQDFLKGGGEGVIFSHV